MAGCGCVTVAVGCHLGSQLGSPPPAIPRTRWNAAAQRGRLIAQRLASVPALAVYSPRLLMM
jgi:hypothetical protein